jgi:hypothetical protein
MRMATMLWLVLCGPALATDVLTQHNDSARTGAVLDEKILSPATLKSQGFGKLLSLAVDGQIYAQPLVVTGLEIPGKGVRNGVFVATMRNMVYAFDAEGGDASPFWRTYLGAPMPYDRIPKDGGALLGQYNIRPYIGVTSTPAIDRARQVLYVVAKIAEPQCPGVEAAPGCPVVYRIHAIDLASGVVLRKSDIRIPMNDPSVTAATRARFLHDSGRRDGWHLAGGQWSGSRRPGQYLCHDREREFRPGREKAIRQQPD